MRTLVCVVLVALLGYGSAQGVLPREVRERILQAVVELQPYDSALDRPVGTAGSGTIISPDGFVLTNFHVVGDIATGRAHEWHGVYVTDPRAPDLAPRFSYWARFVVGDPHHDLAIVHIVEDADENPLPAGFIFPSMPVGDSNSLIPGDPLTVVGYPGISGTTITFTSGIVSGFLGEDLTVGGKQWIKTDAKLARGNSGGAAFDEFGVLVGIPTLRVQTQDGNYIEQQDYLRPIALAWPLITANVASVNRVGGVGSQIASLPPAATQPAATQPAATQPAATQPAANPLAPPRPAASSERAALSFSERGALGPGDQELTAGEYADVIAIEAVAGVEVAVTLTSTAFDAYLVVLGPGGDVVVEVDDAPGMGSDAAAVFVPASSGTYTVIVTSFAAGETGPYHLQVTGAAMVGTEVGAAPADGGGVLLLERGRLASGDFTLSAGEYAHVYELELTAGAPVWFELTSDDFDAYLVVLGPGNEVVLEVDDTAGWGLDVAAGLVPPTSGTYLVAVTSAFAAETGAYELWVREGPPPATATVSGGTPLAVGAGTGLVGPLTPGEQVRAQLAGAGEGIAFHTYYVEVPAGAPQLVVEMAADVDLDLFLKYGSEIVSLGDEGDWDYRDVDAAPRASFTVPAPASGRWYIDVVWLGGGDGTARYTLRAR